MKNIAILVYNIINDYSYSVVGGILDYFSTKNDVHTIISTINVPHGSTLDFDYQYWSAIEILKSKAIDGIIVVTNSFMDKTDLESFSKELSCFADRPVVSISTPLNVEGAKYTFADSTQAYKDVIHHYKTKHNRKKFAFMSASLHGSLESDERLEAFKKALEDNDLEYHPELVFPGDFSPGTAQNAILDRYKNKSDLDFDAIICVNDYSAGGVLLAFQKLGVNCPEDIAIHGFDNTRFALMTYPTLSSIDQNIVFNGQKAAEIIYETLQGKTIEKKTTLQCSPIYRQSCGCIDCKTHSTAFYDAQDNYHEIDEVIRDREYSALMRQMEYTDNLFNLMSLMDTRISMKAVSSVLQKSLKLTNITSVTACFYASTTTLSVTDNFELPASAKLLLQIDESNGINNSFDEETAPEFNPQQQLLPQGYQDSPAGFYFLLPLFLRENNYGYMICETKNDNLSLSAIHLKIISNIIIHAYEFTREQTNKTKLLDRNYNLNYQSKTDELTNVLNRRGFIEYGDRLIDLSASVGKTGVVFFCDLDGLKKINDTYGHKIGDLAIQTEAKVLKTAFQESDLVGRLSGDEFGVIAPGFSIDEIDYLKENLKDLNKQFSQEAGLPFILSISVGPVEYNSENKDLLKLLTQADNKLYEEKKIKHAKN